TPAELRARADALIRRSGRRLNLRGSHLGSISAEELSALFDSGEDMLSRKRGALLTTEGDGVRFAPEFNDRLQRSIETVKKLDQPFAVYWVKASDDDGKLNKSLAKLCRQEDIVCRNGSGEFVAILSGTDSDGVRG